MAENPAIGQELIRLKNLIAKHFGESEWLSSVADTGPLTDAYHSVVSPSINNGNLPLCERHKANQVIAQQVIQHTFITPLHSRRVGPERV